MGHSPSISLRTVFSSQIYRLRLASLLQTLESEGVQPNPDVDAPAPCWPQHGKITFQNVEMRYREDLPLVLKDLSFTVQPEETIGIVGRTGSGLSWRVFLFNSCCCSSFLACVSRSFVVFREVISGRSTLPTGGIGRRLHQHRRDQYRTHRSVRLKKETGSHSSGARALHWHHQVNVRGLPSNLKTGLKKR